MGCYLHGELSVRSIRGAFLNYILPPHIPQDYSPVNVSAEEVSSCGIARQVAKRDDRNVTVMSRQRYDVVIIGTVWHVVAILRFDTSLRGLNWHGSVLLIVICSSKRKQKDGDFASIGAGSKHPTFLVCCQTPCTGTDIGK